MIPTMSVEVILIPLAIAAFAQWRDLQATPAGGGATVVDVQSRMRHEPLVVAALQDCGAQVAATSDGRISATWDGLESTWGRAEDGVWATTLRGDVDIDRAASLAREVDAAYCKRVQEDVLAKIRERAPSAGMNLESEHVDDEGTVTVVLALEG